MKPFPIFLIAFILVASSCNNNTKNIENNEPQASTSKIYDFKVATSSGDSLSLADYRGKVLLIVNVASQCGLTPQYEGLQNLYSKYHDRGLEIIAFPCNQFHGQEPGTNEEIQSFCTLNYNVSFPVMAKIDVNGENESPLYTYLKAEAPFEGCPEEPAEYKTFCEMINQLHQNDSSGFDQGDAIRWNFGKFLINRDGTQIMRFEPVIQPADLEEAIEKML